ncbi:hypothetical protein E1A91_A11G006000v1 [Gossypium mustelinum]|uniref:Uncharacterized protein n=1 Tax=Gossypium mustelinum TaxID=34275 RepID=A0A5D2X139_GOSMU|nr:hypothetical protein E1A91_A11G006000v1 [Gossypium mustelinum]
MPPQHEQKSLEQLTFEVQGPNKKGRGGCVGVVASSSRIRLVLRIFNHCPIIQRQNEVVKLILSSFFKSSFLAKI